MVHIAKFNLYYSKLLKFQIFLKYANPTFDIAPNHPLNLYIDLIKIIMDKVTHLVNLVNLVNPTHLIYLTYELILHVI